MVIVFKVILRQLEYLTALARERHFGRAATACHVSQPALSVAIRKLESELGVQLVHRTHRYDDLTAEGKELLGWAQQALASVDGLTAEASRLSTDVSGRLRLGVIPTALPAVATITRRLLRSHPAVELEVRSLPSSEISVQLEAYGIDAGITYLSGQRKAGYSTTTVYEERFVFLTTEPIAAKEVPWAHLDGLPLCLLTPDMQHRRIVDASLAEAHARVSARIETDSVSALLCFAREGWSSIVSDAWLRLFGVPKGMNALNLVDPERVQPIGIVRRSGDLPSPLVSALLESLSDLTAAAALD